jgi:hypothetical protein
MSQRTKKILRGIACLALTAALVCTASAAQQDTRTIQATFSGIKIYVDGNLVRPKDASGKAIEPFVIDGTTYLPVRAVGEALGKEVQWDGPTQSVYIGHRPGVVAYLGEAVTPFAFSGISHYPENGTFKMDGKVYSRGIVKARDFEEPYAHYNLNSAYSTMEGLYGPVDAVAGQGALVSIYGDEKLLQTIEITGGSLPKKFSVGIEGIKQLKIEFKGRGSTYALADVLLK